MDEGEGVKSLPLQGNFVIKDLPQWSDSEGPKPRTKPKHRVKSKTVSGIALPGLADELNRKRMVAVPTSLDLKVCGAILPPRPVIKLLQLFALESSLLVKLRNII